MAVYLEVAGSFISGEIIMQKDESEKVCLLYTDKMGYLANYSLCLELAEFMGKLFLKQAVWCEKKEKVPMLHHTCSHIKQREKFQIKAVYSKYTFHWFITAFPFLFSPLN